MNIAARISLLLLLSSASVASAQSKSGDVLIDAMRDELDRNITGLKLPGYSTPFFMMYGIQDQRTYTVTASLGAITNSNETHQRFKSNTRLLVGSYEFNDESLDDNLLSSPTALELDLPLDDDYDGIRRSFWSTTDKVYRDAARHFQKHQQTLKEAGKELKDVPHRSFAQAKPVTLITNASSEPWDAKPWEAIARNLSALFMSHPQIQNSVVIVNYVAGYKYLVSSEGTMVKYPVSVATFMTVAQYKSTSGEFAVGQVLHHAKSPSKLPDEKQLKAEIEKMVAGVEAQVNLPKLEEDYSGPVLVTGEPVADMMFMGFMKNRENNVVASDNIPKLKGLQYDKASVMDNKIGKSIVHESLTLKAKPKLETYNGTTLLGSFPVDNEGIVPADEIILVQNGILKELMNNRNLTSPTQVANGFSGAPGVLEITSTYHDSEKELKDKLIAAAKQAGLDFGIIVRERSAPVGGLNVYRVSVADGKEELVRNAYIPNVTTKTLKRIQGASSTMAVHYLSPGQGNNPVDGIASFIVPEGVLFGDLEVKVVRMPSLIDEQYVPNPLGKTE